MAGFDIRLCRVYDPPEQKEGAWVLIDRLWPRGIKKDKIPFDLWLKEIAPSTDLRKWFNHEAEKWDEFQQRYREELKNKRELIEKIQQLAKRFPLTLFYGAKSNLYNHAIVLKKIINEDLTAD